MAATKKANKPANTKFTRRDFDRWTTNGAGITVTKKPTNKKKG